MSREQAIKVVLKLTTALLKTYRCQINEAAGSWQMTYDMQSRQYPDQLWVLLAGLAGVFPVKASNELPLRLMPGQKPRTMECPVQPRVPVYGADC